MSYSISTCYRNLQDVFVRTIRRVGARYRRDLTEDGEFYIPNGVHLAATRLIALRGASGYPP